MKYDVKIKPRAIKDLLRIGKDQATIIASSLEGLRDDLQGDVKKLTNHTPEYRLRVGTYRVLFEIVESDCVVV